MELIHKILSWSEVWAMLIPLIMMIIFRSRLAYLKPIRIYVILVFLISIAIVSIYQMNKPYYPNYRYSNNFLYNTHSLLRFLLFSWFFALIGSIYLKKFRFIVPALFILFVGINFLFFEDFLDFWSFSGRLLTIESGILLLYCLRYYFHVLTRDEYNLRKQPSFWVVTALSVYVVINFPIFLFYKTLLDGFKDFAVDIWDVHNISYVIFCIFLAKAFYEAGKKRIREPQNPES